MRTGKNLHSHNFNSPLSSNKEISAYGWDGNGDEGDNWEIVCEKQGALNITGKEKFSLKHVVTGAYLYSH